MVFGDLVNVMVGLSITFALMALITSALTEAIASAFKWRAATLLTGLQDLLNDHDLNGLVGQLMTHAAINPRGPGPAAPGTPPQKLSILPSYIPPAQFAAALLDILQQPARGATAPTDLAAAIDTLKTTNPQIGMLLGGIYDRAGGDVGLIRQNIASWFDNAMDRVSGAYKRDSMIWQFGISLVLAGLLNVNAMALAAGVWHHADLIAALPVTARESNAAQALGLLAGDFPLGWGAQGAAPLTSLASWALPGMLLGWAITAIATLFGAPFWFDTLSVITRLKGTGAAPAEPPPAAASSHASAAPG